MIYQEVFVPILHEKSLNWKRFGASSYFFCICFLLKCDRQITIRQLLCHHMYMLYTYTLSMVIPLISQTHFLVLNWFKLSFKIMNKLMNWWSLRLFRDWKKMKIAKAVLLDPRFKDTYFLRYFTTRINSVSNFCMELEM